MGWRDIYGLSLSQLRPPCPSRLTHATDCRLYISPMFYCIILHLFFLSVTKIVLSSHADICILHACEGISGCEPTAQEMRAGHMSNTRCHKDSDNPNANINPLKPEPYPNPNHNPNPTNPNKPTGPYQTLLTLTNTVGLQCAPSDRHTSCLHLACRLSRQVKFPIASECSETLPSSVALSRHRHILVRPAHPH